MPKRLYIETVGCQMNMLDSELVVAALRRQGYELARKSAEADVILFNTCSVRQHAEDKIYSALGRLKMLKTQHPEKIIGVLGCMAQKDQELIFKRAPYVDLVVGPGQLHQVPDLVSLSQAGGGPRIEVSLDRASGARSLVEQSFESYDPLRDLEMRASPYQAFVRIMIGCDKFCTYCIVPSVRGPEQSRSPQHIEAEVRRLAEEGCLEVTLLGQTVNSYKYTEGEKTHRLSDLLERLQEIPGLRRIRFITNFPKDMTIDLLHAVRDLPKCCTYLHIPAQSGSDKMLKMMKRGYSVAEYREMLAKTRETIPHCSVTSDFIVGFCQESEEDFQATMDLVKESRFKNSYIFKYSERPGTKAPERWPDDVPEEIKKVRNNELLGVQNAISEEDNQYFVGKSVEILVEGPSKNSEKWGEEGPIRQLTGRTSCDRIVVFDGHERLTGTILDVDILEASAFTLFGRVPTSEVGVERHGISLPAHVNNPLAGAAEKSEGGNAPLNRFPYSLPRLPILAMDSHG